MSTLAIARSRRRRLSKNNTIGITRSIVKLSEDVGLLLGAPLVASVASIVLTLLEIAKEVNENEDCRVRLAVTSATYLLRISPFLTPDSSENAHSTLKECLEDFSNLLLDMMHDLEAMARKKLWRRIFQKDEIATRLLDHEKRLLNSYNALMLWATIDTNISVRNHVNAARDRVSAISEKELHMDPDKVLQFDQADVELLGCVKDHRALGDVYWGEVILEGFQVPVLVERFENRKTEWHREVKAWRKLWHPHLPQMVGCSRVGSATPFILFRAYDLCSFQTFVKEMLKRRDIFSCANKIVDFANDTISAVRHVQVKLELDERQVAALVEAGDIAIAPSQRVMISVPLHFGGRSYAGVADSIFWSFFLWYPKIRTTTRIDCHRPDNKRRSVSTDDLDYDGIKKWASMEALFDQLIFHRNGVERPIKYTMPRTRGVMIARDTDARIGCYAVLIHKHLDEFTLRALDHAPLPFASESLHKVHDCDFNDYSLISESPFTWRLNLSGARCTFCHRSVCRLSDPVYPSTRDLSLSAPWSAIVDGDELIFVVGIAHLSYYEYVNHLSCEYQCVGATLAESNTDDLQLAFFTPTRRENACNGQMWEIKKVEEYTRIEYVVL